MGRLSLWIQSHNPRLSFISSDPVKSPNYSSCGFVQAQRGHTIGWIRRWNHGLPNTCVGHCERDRSFHRTPGSRHDSERRRRPALHEVRGKLPLSNRSRHGLEETEFHLVAESETTPRERSKVPVPKNEPVWGSRFENAFSTRTSNTWECRRYGSFAQGTMIRVAYIS